MALGGAGPELGAVQPQPITEGIERSRRTFGGRGTEVDR
jgi:hypothetical protein